MRQTEAELEAQAVVLAAAYRQELRRVAPEAPLAPIVPADPESPLSDMAVRLLSRPGLDLAVDPILTPPPDPLPAATPAEPQAASVGRALLPLLRDAHAVTLAALEVTDPHGVVVASTNDDVGRSLAHWPEVADVLAGAPVATSMRRRDPVRAPLGSISRTSRLRVFVALPVPGAAGLAGVVVLSRTPRDEVQAIWSKRWPLAALTAGLLATGAVLAAGLSRLITRPLSRVVVQAQRAALGAEVAPLKHPGTREVADLSASLTRLAATLERRARYIIAFAASVSHEFKTPLTGLRGAAELLQDHSDTMPESERARLLSVMVTTTKRLDQLVRRLLELARADMTRPDETVGTAVAPVLADLLPRYQERGMHIQYLPGNDTVALSADALAAIFASLLDNAAVHAGADGVGAVVTVDVSTVDRRVQILVRDNGPGISPANRAHIFEPFFTTAREHGGTGLGLSIVRSIAVGANGRVDLVDSKEGACLRIELPAGYM